jgi:lipoyl(octanoyl) transferase
MNVEKAAMEPLTCRLVPFKTASGPENMADDEALLESALAGSASLRFYTWSEPTVSLGYFQPAAARLRQPAHAGLPFVRRPSGGAALLHDRELTYCLALPAGSRWQGGASWLGRMHAIIGSALEELGVSAQLATREMPAGFTGFLCFAHQTPGDLLLAGNKIAGSAQRRQRDAVMQHGGILLGASRLEPSLPGIAELSGRPLAAEEVRDAVARAFARETRWLVRAATWTSAESARIAALAAVKYTQTWWNEKR